MFLNEKYKNNILNFIKFIKKNIWFILLITSFSIGLGFFYIKKNDTFSIKLELVLNLELFNEIKLYPNYVFDSKEFNDYLDENLKNDFIKVNVSSNKKITIKDYIQYFPSGKRDDPYMSIVYSNNSKELVESFEDHFIKLSDNFFTRKKNSILNDQIKKLETEYRILKNETIGTDISTDPQVTSLIAKLTYWRTLRNQSSPMITLIQSEVYPTLNKKIIFLFSFIFGILIGLFIALLKETIKELKTL